MTMHEKVKINTATAQEIASLREVGPARAGRIVEYREQNGFFTRPEDLGKVKSVGLALAEALAPSIDWSVPPGPEEPKPREWLRLLIFALLASLPPLLFLLHPARELWGWGALIWASPRRWLVLWPGLIVVAFVALFYMFLSVQLAYALTTSRRIARRYSGLGYKIMGASALMILLGIAGMGVLSWLLTPEGLAGVAFDPYVLSLALTFLLLLLIYGPPLVVVYRPAWAYKPLLAKVYDVAFVLGGPVCLWEVWHHRDDMPWWFGFFPATIGLIFLVRGFSVGVRRTSYFKHPEYLLDPFAPSQDEDDDARWIEWLNTKLPNEADQARLIRALNKRHSLWRAYARQRGLLILAGGALLPFAFKAVAELEIQSLWAALTCYLFGWRCTG